MSQEQQEQNNQEQDEDQQNQDEDEDEDGEQQDQQDQQNQQQDQQQQDQDQDQEQQNQDEDQEEQQQSQKKTEQQYKLPNFPRFQKPVDFNLDNICNEISNLKNSVQNLIDTFPSQKKISYPYSYDQGNNLRSSNMRSNLQRFSELEKPKTNIVYLKDQDTQVNLQPQIIIKTSNQKIEQVPLKKYTINSESEKFLNKFYEDSKKYKRWDRSNLQQKNRSRFQRRETEKGIFNLEQRNREIDQAIRSLKEERN